MTDPVLYEADGGGVITLTLHRPEVRNPLSDDDMLDAILAALTRLDADPSVRVAILTGAGKAFSSGGNMQAMRVGGGLKDELAVPTRATPLEMAAPMQALAHATGEHS